MVNYDKIPNDTHEAYSLIAATAEQMTKDADLFQRYLNVQSRFDYSVNNAILIAVQNPDAIKLADASTWKRENVLIKKGEKGIVILEPEKQQTRSYGSTDVGYNAKKMYDITQTDSEKYPQRASYDPKKLLQALIYNRPCEIEISNALPDKVKAAYLPQDKKILVRQGMSAPELFRRIAGELAHAHMDMGDYNRSKCAFPAYCVAYMLCKRFGVDTDAFRFGHLPDAVRSMDNREIRDMLKKADAVMVSMSADMSCVLHPKDRVQKKYRRDAR